SSPSKEITEAQGGGRPSAEDVARRLSQRRPDFLKCFGTLLQKNHRSRGLVDVTFTILPTGRISQPSARSEEIRDETFQNCLFEVLQRIRFSAFTGEAVLAKFPLVFD
ncbi:MAG: AgmX/PglI C-terminal domain-containing protein, partial [Bdellovibrio sp.]